MNITKDFFSPDISHDYNLHPLEKTSAEAKEAFVSTGLTYSSVNSAVYGRKVIKKIEGYICMFDGEDAIVRFVEKGEEFEYIIPAHELTRNNISRPGQPFEYIEAESWDREKKIYITSQYYKAKCRPDEFEFVALDLDENRRKKLNDILSHRQ